MTALLPTAEHVLDVALERATLLIRDGHVEDAVRALAVGTAAADLIEQQGDAYPPLRLVEIEQIEGPAGHGLPATQ